jgi:Domain of unknown function (DUF4143)
MGGWMKKNAAKTYELANLFEHLVIVEAIKMSDQTKAGAQLMYFRSADEAEIDLIAKRGESVFAIEI